MNSVNLIGRSCGDPSIKYVGQNKQPCAEFTLAVDDPFAKKPDGSKKSYFFLITVWGAKAEIAHQHIVKGQRLGISGRLTQEEFTPAGESKPVTKTRIVCESFTLLDKPQGHQSRDSSWRPPANEPPAGHPADEPPVEDDIPF